jgi:hypothetical protein
MRRTTANGARSGRWPLAVLGTSLLLTLFVACGVPKDHEPRAIDPGNVPFALLAPTSSAPEPTVAGPSSLETATVYLVDAQGHLVATTREVRFPATLPKVVSALLAGVTDAEAARKLRSAIAPGTKLRGLDGPIEGVLTVDISDDLLGVTGRRQIEALAQVLFTVTSVRGVEQVLFEFEGERHDVPRGDGELTSSPLTRRDFRTLEPAPSTTSSTATTYG